MNFFFPNAPVKAGLYVLVHGRGLFARRSKVNHLYGAPVGGPKEDIFGFEITVDDIHFGKGKKGECFEHLAGKLSDEHEVHALEVSAPEKVVQVKGHVLEHEARVTIMVEVLKKSNCGGEKRESEKTWGASGSERSCAKMKREDKKYYNTTLQQTHKGAQREEKRDVPIHHWSSGSFLLSISRRFISNFACLRKASRALITFIATFRPSVLPSF